MNRVCRDGWHAADGLLLAVGAEIVVDACNNAPAALSLSRAAASSLLGLLLLLNRWMSHCPRAEGVSGAATLEDLSRHDAVLLGLPGLCGDPGLELCC